jgi:RNA polymerase sigma-70 factor, ECF subfamily
MVPAENELILKAASGDEYSFTRLVQKYDKQVLSLALKYSSDPDDAKDIYQDVFIRVFKSLKGFRFQSEFSTWLYRITTNVCLTYKSKAKKEIYVRIGNEPEENEEIDYKNISPEDSVSQNEFAEHLSAALNKLTPRQKMIFLLKHYEGFKIKEIAEILSISEGSVKKYLFEAVHKLKILLNEFMAAGYET